MRIDGAKAAVREIGTNAVLLIEKHYRRHKKPSETANAAIKLVQLAELHSAESVDAACQRAVVVDLPNPRKVEEVIAAGLVNYATDEPQQPKTFLLHAMFEGSSIFPKS